MEFCLQFIPYDPNIIHVRRGIILCPVAGLAQPKALLVKRAPAPISKLDPLKLECLGGQVKPGEPELVTLQREVMEESGLKVVRILSGPYDYSRPPEPIGNDRKALYLVNHYHVEVEPFTLDDVVLSREHVEKKLVDLMDIVNMRFGQVERANGNGFPIRRSALLSLTAFAEDIGLIPKFEDQHPELFPKPVIPHSV